ncbi:sugar ABC transporter ATP-binding protein [Actinotignum sp. GS-2025c]|uniref:sugar ABC transporter ATP-binding protein n=1 Tax=unclassified Actinotignum TaxID=2632702 RepID=UPI003F467005
MDVALSANHITKSFGGVTALDDVSLDILPGEVHCFAGENGSGKSTMVKIMSGALASDSGEISIMGEAMPNLSARQATGAGVGVIYQDLSLFPTMSVSDNIALPSLAHHKVKMIRAERLEKIASDSLAQIGADIDLRTPVEKLSMAKRQQVAIARALALKATIIFMDEPTTALTSVEVGHLLDTILHLKAQGVATIFISHKLDEVMQVSDRITVFRSGKKVGTYPAKDMTPKSLSALMTGRDVEFGHPGRSEPGSEVLSFENVQAFRVNGATLSVHKGEVVGLGGLLGSGRTELALAAFGLNPISAGKVFLDGEQVALKNPSDAIAKGIALVPEDRQVQGLFNPMSLSKNMVANVLPVMTTKADVLDGRRINEVTGRMLESFKVNTRNADLPVSALSGGNQQKIVLGKTAVSNPKVLILDSPTVGVDVGAKSQIYELIRELSTQGVGILVISDEEEELLAVCNRIYVMQEGRITAELFDDSLKPGFSSIYRGAHLNTDEEN